MNRKILLLATLTVLTLVAVACTTACQAVQPAALTTSSAAQPSELRSIAERAELWVTNTTTNDLAVFDADSGALRGVVPGFAKPVGLASAAGKIYVANESGNNVWVLDKRDLSVVARIATGPKPHHIVSSPNGRLVYVSELGTNKIGVIDTATDSLLAEYVTGASAARTHAPELSPDGKILYAVNTVTNEIAALDALTGNFLWSMPVGSDPNEFVTSADGATGFVSIRGEDRIQVIDLATQTMVATVQLATGSAPETLLLAPNGHWLQVALRRQPAAVAMIDLDANFDVTYIALGSNGAAGHNAGSTNGRYTFVSEANPGAVAVIDMNTRTVATSFSYPGGGAPHGVLYDVAGSRATP